MSFLRPLPLQMPDGAGGERVIVTENQKRLWKPPLGLRDTDQPGPGERPALQVWQLEAKGHLVPAALRGEGIRVRHARQRRRRKTRQKHSQDGHSGFLSPAVLQYSGPGAGRSPFPVGPEPRLIGR